MKRILHSDWLSLGLSTSCSRFSKHFPVISQKAAQENRNFFETDARICKLYNKNKISRTKLKQGAHIHQPTNLVPRGRDPFVQRRGSPSAEQK